VAVKRHSQPGAKTARSRTGDAAATKAGERPRTDDATRAQVARLEQLVHELANLVDGSMRCMNLVMRERAQPRAGAGGPEVARAGASASEDAASAGDKRLQTVRTALGQMAVLLRAEFDARRSGGEGGVGGVGGVGGAISLESLAGTLTLREAVEHAMAILEPMARQAGARVSAEAAVPEGMAAGPAYTVALNGLRNALESVNRLAFGLPRRVEMRVWRGEEHGRRVVLMRIVDSGVGLAPGAGMDAGLGGGAGGGAVRSGGAVTDRGGAMSTKTGGRGVGLGLCREMISELGGRISLKAREDGPGAELEAVWPELDARNGRAGS
jgi:signal transduction histidine kinase